MAAGHDVALVVTRPDRRRGRGGALLPSPVKQVALAEAIPVTESVDDVIGAGVDLAVVVAFGRLIKPHVLERVPMLNVHFSLLPRWRGAAPVERAILAGDTETGVCLMAVDEGLDTGPVYRCQPVAIAPEETAEDLRERLAAIGARLLVEELDAGLGQPTPQVGDATYAAKLEPGELRLDWSRPAEELHRVVRLGRAWTTFRGRRLRVLGATVVGDGPPTGVLEGVVVGAGDGRGLELVEVQAEGRAAVLGEDWIRGARATAGERLGA
ncbi:MAG: methionyl-tRNA formyltransferase [Actinomycetota bacterium]|nr:methionyl-tRNA formyltransferase [Actinomycetota bacterium]